YWQCFEQLTHHDACGRLSALSLIVEQTRVCRKLLSAQGRGRYLLRLALSRKALPQFITHLLHTPRVLEVRYMDQIHLCLEILTSRHIAVKHGIWTQQNVRDLLIVCTCFQVCERYEVVPCREVGMVLRYLSGRVFVLELMPGSQAHVDKFISPGDIIDEINGTSLRNSKNGQAGVVLSRLKGCPLSIGVLRWRAQDGTVYLPLIKLLQALRMEDPTLQLGPANIMVNNHYCFTIYVQSLCIPVLVSPFGGKEVLQHAITQVLQKNLPSKEVLLDMKETFLQLQLNSLNFYQELFEHHYPEISCVGRFSQGDYTIFAFCVVDSPETPQSTGFCCVALRASTIKECEVIVCRIATGFKHTEWFV
uniref:PDZ domain-containing protein n=1 Tax=Sander lucioperca TaxID=283035 RepID=A0A8D0A530_SANLU